MGSIQIRLAIFLATSRALGAMAISRKGKNNQCYNQIVFFNIEA